MIEKNTDYMSGYKLIIAKKIDTYLTDSKMSNKDFGELFGVTEANVRKWRKLEGALNIDQIVTLCKFWKISINQLLDIDDENELSEIDKERLRKIKENPELATVIDNYKK